MSVYLRGKSYHYRFLFKGKDYSGVCSGCSTEGRAKEYERTIREKIRREAETLSAEEEKIRQNKTIRAFVDNCSYYVLTGGKPVTPAETGNHCETYLCCLIDCGRFNRKVEFYVRRTRFPI